MQPQTYKQSKSLATMGAVFIVVSIAVTLLTLTDVISFGPGPGGKGFVPVIMAGFFAVGCWALLSGVNKSVTVDDHGVTITGITGATEFRAYWSDIVRYEATDDVTRLFGTRWVISTHNGTHDLPAAPVELQKVMLHKLPPAAWGTPKVRAPGTPPADYSGRIDGSTDNGQVIFGCVGAGFATLWLCGWAVASLLGNATKNRHSSRRIWLSGRSPVTALPWARIEQGIPHDVSNAKDERRGSASRRTLCKRTRQ